MSLTYREAVDRVMSLADFERSTHEPGHSGFHLERAALLLAEHGDPHLSIPTVHVAGTKGKGSVAAMIAAAISNSGLSTGLYTSPHLHTVRERIRLDHKPVSESHFAQLVEHTWPTVTCVAANGGYGGVTTFEMMTLMAFVCFSDADSDAQVIEVGLGGRLDSTNVVDPMVTVITSISLDHTTVLGSTIREIAGEKAGIIKPGVPVVLAPQPAGSEDATLVVRETAARLGAPLVEVAETATITTLESGRWGQRIRVLSAGIETDITLPLAGGHQAENAATALVALHTAGRRFMPIDGQMSAALETLSWPCRVEHLPTGDDGPALIADGAHNDDSMARLIESVPELSEEDAVVVFGSLSGHSAESMLTQLRDIAPRIVIVRSRHPRAASCDSLTALASSIGLSVIGIGSSVAEGVELAMASAGRNGTVLATGSLSVAAEAREWAMNIAPECYPSIRHPTGPDGSAALTPHQAPNR